MSHGRRSITLIGVCSNFKSRMEQFIIFFKGRKLKKKNIKKLQSATHGYLVSIKSILWLVNLIRDIVIKVHSANFEPPWMTSHWNSVPTCSAQAQVPIITQVLLHTFLTCYLTLALLVTLGLTPTLGVITGCRGGASLPWPGKLNSAEVELADLCVGSNLG